jgi:hypothetical protein
MARCSFCVLEKADDVVATSTSGAVICFDCAILIADNATAGGYQTMISVTTVVAGEGAFDPPAKPEKKP